MAADSSLTEVTFIHAHNGKKKIDPEQDWVQIDIFGRGNNAYRWAGETDVWEVTQAFFGGESNADRAQQPDPARVVLRGFSMGGAGTWHLGLHFPDRWCVMGPGAGFTTTHDYAWKGKKDLPPYQEKCLRIYDAIDYAQNARMIPIVAYSGGDDPQKLAADNIKSRLTELKIDTMAHLVKPGVGHKFDADYFVKANALWSAHATKGRSDQVRYAFLTYTMKYPACEAVFLDYLEKHYEPAVVEVDRSQKLMHITTKNIAGLSVVPSELFSGGADRKNAIAIDGQMVKPAPDNDGAPIVLRRERGIWKSTTPNEFWKAQLEVPRKRWRLQGPIDDAFASGFVCVQGTGKTWHPATQKFVDAKLNAFKLRLGQALARRVADHQ